MPFDPMMLIVILIPVFIVVFILIFVLDQKINKEKYAAMMKEKEAEEDEEFERDAEIVTVHAEIVDMVCGTGMVGSYRLPKSSKTFIIKFSADSGEVYELSVPEEYYLELSVGQTGTLTIVEGNLDSFELD